MKTPRAPRQSHGRGIVRTRQGRLQYTVYLPQAGWGRYTPEEIAAALSEAATQNYRSVTNLTLWVVLHYLVQNGYLENRGIGSLRAAGKEATG